MKVSNYPTMRPVTKPAIRSDELTLQQKKVLAFVTHCILVNTLAPTIREICQTFGFKSPNAANTHLRALQRKGYLKVEEVISRGITLAKPMILIRDGRVYTAGGPTGEQVRQAMEDAGVANGS